MILDIDIYLSATIIKKRYGGDAPIEAAMRADLRALRGGRVLVGRRTTVMGFPLLLRYSLFAPKLFFC